MHTTQGIGHTVRGGTGSHVVGVKSTTSTATRGYREVGLASKHALLLIGTGYGVLETCGVGRVTCDRHINILQPVDSHTLTNVISAIAVHLGTGTVRVSDAVNHVHLTCIVVKLSLYISKSVDTADDHSSIFAQTVKDATQGVLTHLVSHLGNLDSTLSSGEALVSSQEGETLSLLAQQTSSQVTMSDTNLTVISHRTWDAEALQTDTDSLSSLSSSLHALLDGDSSTANISPFGILKADTLSVLANLIRINTCFFANLISLFDILDTILVKRSNHLLDTALLAFKTYFSYHRLFLLILYVGQYSSQFPAQPWCDHSFQ